MRNCNLHDVPSLVDCRHCASRALAVCNAIDDAHIDALESIITPICRKAGQIIFEEGDRVDHVFNITAGVLKTFKMLPDGRRQITGFLMTADILGLAGREGFAYGAEAINEVHLCKIARRDFDGLMRRYPELEHRMLAVARDELAAAQEQILLLGRKRADERVASFLLGLSKRAPQRRLLSDRLDLVMTRADIADFLGLTLETVSRVFGQFKKQGLIALAGPHEVQLKNIPRLRELAGGETEPA